MPSDHFFLAFRLVNFLAQDTVRAGNIVRRAVMIT